MLIQKTFHVHQPLQETKDRLANTSLYRRRFFDVKKAILTADGIGHFEFLTGAGFRALIDVQEVASEDENTKLFASYNGNVDVLGSVEFFAVKPGLTEVVLTVDYRIHSFIFRVVDRLTNSVDRFVNHQLALMDDYLKGVSRATYHEFVPVPSRAEGVLARATSRSS